MGSAFNSGALNTQQWNGSGVIANGTYSLTDFAVQALYDLNCLWPGQFATADHLNVIFTAANQMVDAWQINGLLIPAAVGNLYPLKIGQAQYSCGPGGDIDPRPNQILDMNLLLTQTLSPVVRKRIFSRNVDQWADITVRGIAPSLPQVYYFDKGFDAGGLATLNLWPPPDQPYQIELFTQGMLQQFVDQTTQYLFPPGYALMIRKSLAVTIAPMMRHYWKIPQPLVQQLALEAARAMGDVSRQNAPTPILEGDPAFMGTRGGGWNYAIGDYNRSGG